MKFQCSSCGLRLESLHFKLPGLVNDRLASLCDICRQRGLDPAAYPNPVVKLFAANLLYAFVGKDGDFEGAFTLPDKKVRRSYEALMQDYDGNVLAKQQLPRADFNRAVIKAEDDPGFFLPGQLPFAEKLQALGLSVDFQLNEVDYIDRERIRAKYKYRCQYCGRRGRSVDHKDPVSLSRDNRLDNLILSCAECNRIKSNMPYELFVKLNDEVQPLNRKLVKYENALAPLKKEFQDRRNLLAAKVHLKGVVNDPELAAIRQQNKRLQDAIDSLQSDYDAARLLREEHFKLGWKLFLLQQDKEII
ncbi:restriction endonuclease [Lactobacillus nasalidis]|uniref:Restriction endonuclease n=1 Tax=Lactobacillus nasalidis TaxID=2797258 RepID=A0ABQ3W7N3_9LACO|nr:HNH endonuclease signature motif containing protein [Lactobacillus nasalidis]GHV97600.1 restriction endonuclease [Lactobacillus nasalidis]GHV99360.1 restriction endonuclease [Lactobacillus nasalidis]GHW01551.1 restriction endonuclease [Lactobacillus nasalidis]